VTAGKLSKGDKLGAVDHAAISYPPFRKNFYIEVPELARLSESEVAALRAELDGIKVRGRGPPKPLRAFTQAGLAGRVLEALRKRGYERPLPIQAQALPVIMSGRDCIGIAKTGSGKTLAFVLPLLRHMKDQPPLASGEGPIGLIMAPTRELVQQIAKEVKAFAKPAGMTCVAVFGGSGVANQITELKRGAEVVVATPGRLIDLLATSNGRITNLRRVTYLVMDEADRMFGALWVLGGGSAHRGCLLLFFACRALLAARSRFTPSFRKPPSEPTLNPKPSPKPSEKQTWASSRRSCASWPTCAPTGRPSCSPRPSPKRWRPWRGGCWRSRLRCRWAAARS
jgi:hypothetical protein